MLVPTLQQRKSEIASRLSTFQRYIGLSGADACILEDPYDLFYFTGLDLSAGRLWISIKGAALFVDSRYIDVALKESLVQPVFLLKKEEEKKFIEKIRPLHALFDGAKTPYNRASEIKSFLATLSCSVHIDAKEGITNAVRMIKGRCEIYDIKQSVLILRKAFNHLKAQVKTGITEEALASEFEIFIRKQGSTGSSFDPIVAFEKNASMPHYRPKSVKLKNNQMVLFDIGCVFKHYRTDMTRIFFHGTPNPALLRMASVVKQAKDIALHRCSPGVKVGDIDHAVREFFKKETADHLFTHSLGHGIGLQTHEPPVLRFDGRDKDITLQPGMVITIEPGLYLADVGGVRLEDMILITQDGYENLTQKI